MTNKIQFSKKYLHFCSFKAMVRSRCQNQRMEVIMSLKKLCLGAIVFCSFVSVSGFAVDAMRAATAVQTNTKYSPCLTLTRDQDRNIIGFHVNGINPEDAGILLTNDSAPLSTEFTIISGITPEGGLSAYMLPSNAATAHVVESLSRDLVNAGAVNIQIIRQSNGKAAS